MPKYRYAYDSAENLVDVLQLPHQYEPHLPPFSCIGCGQELIAKTKGEQRVKHFAHYPCVECTPETYLHKLGKQVFYDVYSACLNEGRPFEIEVQHAKVCRKYERLLKTSCSVGTVAKIHDLTRYYTGIKLETPDGQFIPDLLLFSKKDPEQKLYIEIAVTHFLSKKKRHSGQRIIEIPLQDEADVDTIESCHLTPDQAAFVNFATGSVSATDDECSCVSRTLYCLFIYKSNKVYLEKGTPGDILAKMYRVWKSTKHTRSYEPSTLDRGPSWIFRHLLEEARDEGVFVKNCYLCRYGGDNWDKTVDKPIFCKLHKIRCDSNRAASCSEFRKRTRPWS